ncbi:EAL domain-containing protein [Myxococcota bacterium]|nr:EAL domain-containing protein [Myxococcota bacterium]
MSIPEAVVAPLVTARLLIVARTTEERARLARTLTGLGHEVETVADTERAVERLEARAFDVVMALPAQVTEAAELATWMRVRHPETPVVLVATAEFGAAALDVAGPEALVLVPPPAAPADLDGAIDRALARRAAWRQAPPHRHADLTASAPDPASQAAFEDALSRLYLVFQPIVRANSGCVVGYEALLRTTSPRFRGASPLLSLAGSLGRLGEVDQRVRALLAAEYEDAAQWRSFFLNQDASVLDDGLLGSDDDPLLPYASRLVVEFGASLRLPPSPEVTGSVLRMRQAGYRIAVGDHAGVTPAPARMRALAPDLYKLSGAVVHRCDQSASRRRTIAEVVELAHADGALVVAQGIERPEEHQVAVELGCDLLQGFLVGMPRAAFD